MGIVVLWYTFHSNHRDEKGGIKLDKGSSENKPSLTFLLSLKEAVSASRLVAWDNRTEELGPTPPHPTMPTTSHDGVTSSFLPNCPTDNELTGARYSVEGGSAAIRRDQDALLTIGLLQGLLPALLPAAG